MSAGNRKTPSDLEAFELKVIASAVIWKAFVRLGPFDRRSFEGPTFEAALAAGRALLVETGRAVMVYAINADGRSVMAGTIRLDGSFAPAVRGWEPPAA